MLAHRTHQALGLLLALTLAACGEPARPPSLLLVSIDTTRPDHLGVYGYERDTTPALDALAAEALVFDQALTVSENTLIAHASLFTGLFPTTHGTTHRGDGWALHPAFSTIAEDLHGAGYQTAGFAAHGDWLTEEFGVDQGFDTWVCAYRPADEVLADARAWLDERDPTRPFFLFVHLFDVHSDRAGRPYQAPAPFGGRWTSDYDGPWSQWSPDALGGSSFLRAVMDGDVEADQRGIAHLRDQYDEGLAWTDDQLGRFLASLAPAERDDTWIAVTSDHGEEFYEHERMLHSAFYDEIVRVPLILAPPRRRAQAFGVPRRVDGQVSLVDLRPTLGALLGLPSPDDAQGVDLSRWLSGELSTCPAGPVPFYRFGLRHQGFKLVFDRGGPRLFDLTADPAEQHDLALRPRAPATDDDPHAVRQREMTAYLKRMEQWHSELREHLLQNADADAAPGMDPEADERLRALGYVR